MKFGYWKIVTILISIATIWYANSIERSKAEAVQHRPIYWDVVSYYAYLPATFIHHDLSLSFVYTEKKPEYKYRFWPENTPNKGFAIKTTMGIAWLYAPFFFAAHGYALANGYVADGFSWPYQYAIGMSGLFYGLWGLWLMGGLLRRYFPDLIVCLTLISFTVATNLFNYITYEAAMSHAFNFFLVACLLVLNERWHREPNKINSFWLGFFIGWITVVRPTNLLVVLIPIFFGLGTPLFKEKYRILKENPIYLVLAVLGALLIGFPQLLYWKLNSGQWLFFSYTGERFFWDRPVINYFLFSYRKGWLVYSPILVLSLVGLFFMRNKLKAYLYPTLVILPFIIYLLSCWWSWWFGGGFGSRPMVDWYALLMFPFAAMLLAIFKKHWSLRLSTIALIGFFIALSWHQHWQYRIGMLHFDSMSKDVYKAIFFKSQFPANFEGMLDPPAYGAAIKGKKEKVETIFD